MWENLRILVLCTLIAIVVSNGCKIIRPTVEEVIETELQWLNAGTATEVRKFLAMRMMRNMNASADPCDDFYDFACGNYANNFPETPEAVDSFNDYSYVNLVHTKLISQVLGEPINDFDSSAEKKAKTMYSKCEKGMSSNIIPVLKRIGFKDPGDATSGDYEFDWREVIKAAPKYNIYLLTEIITRKYNSSVEDYVAYISNLPGIMDALMELEPKETADKLFPIESGLAALPKPNLTEEAASEDTSTEFSAQVGALFDKYTKEEVNDYLFFLGYDVLSQYLVSTSKECATFVAKKMMEPILSLYVKRHLNIVSYMEVHNMVERIVEEERKMVSEAAWISEEVTNEIIQNIVNITEKDIGFPYLILNETLLNEKYAAVNADDTNFLTEEESEDDENADTIEKFMKANAYRQIPPKVHLTLGLLQPPFYHLYFPRFYNYGNLGKIIGYQYAYDFGTKHDVFDVSRKRARTFDYKTRGRYNQLLACFHSTYGRMKTEENIMINSHRATANILADNIGLHLAYQAYVKWHEDHRVPDIVEMKDFEELKLTREQAFFVSGAQSFCNAGREPYKRNSDRIPDYLRLHGIFSNSKEFAAAFKCPHGARMNPPKKCDFTQTD